MDDGDQGPRDYSARLRKREVRPCTISARVGKYVVHQLRLETAALLDGVTPLPRPLTRGDCMTSPRPCPFAGCLYHLALDVNPRTGSIKLNYPDLETWELPESCALDVADRGEATLEQVAALLNIVRERVRQVEAAALRRIKAHPLVILIGDETEGGGG